MNISRAISFVAVLSCTAGDGVHAQMAAPGDGEYYPSRQLRFVIPFPPQGGVDTVGRIIAQGLREFLWQTVVVDNRGGNSGISGADLVAKAAPDGYTLRLNASSS